MMLKNISRFKAMHTFLLAHPNWASDLNLNSVPSRVTLSRRFKQLTSKCKSFVEYLGDMGVSLDAEGQKEVV